MHTQHTDTLTKRELIAAMALQGLLAYPGDDLSTLTETAKMAVRFADALLAELRLTETKKPASE